jgi:UDP-glucose 4-epimerase
MILITGGAGYIGSHANKILNKRGHETVVYDNLSRGHREFVKWGHFVEGDLADKDRLRFCFETYKISAVMHYGAFCYVGESVTHPSEYYRNNVANTLNLLEVMVEYGVKYFIFSSSCSTYGNPLQIPMTEDHPQQPINPYGKSKLMIEQILRDYDKAYGIRNVFLRYFNAAGADPEGEIGEWHEPETHLIPLALQVAARQREHIHIYGTDYETPDGTCIRDYIHINDLAEGHLLALKYLQNGAPSDSFNLGNGSGFSVKEVIDAARRVTGKYIKVVTAERREGDPPILVGSSDKARKILNWLPQYQNIDDIIKTAWIWQAKEVEATKQIRNYLNNPA